MKTIELQKAIVEFEFKMKILFRFILFRLTIPCYAHNFDLSKNFKRNYKTITSYLTSNRINISTMKFTKPTIVALAVAPAFVSSWSIGPTYYSVPLRLESATPVKRVLKKQRMIAQRMFDQQIGHPSQRYELIDNDEKFQLMVDVPGVKEEDIDIKLDEGQLTIKGQRVATSESSRFTSKFSQSFSLDPPSMWTNSLQH